MDTHEELRRVFREAAMNERAKGRVWEEQLDQLRADIEREIFSQGAAAERARLLPVMEQMEKALRAMLWHFEDEAARTDPIENRILDRGHAALAAYAAALAPSAAREEPK